MARHDYETVCSRKESYRTREQAQKAAASTRLSERAKGGRLDAYGCPFSAPGQPHFHVGHRRRHRDDAVYRRRAATKSAKTPQPRRIGYRRWRPQDALRDVA